MIPVGYLAKRSCDKPTGFEMSEIDDVYSVSCCVNDDFADYIEFWRHNGFWLFDSPKVIQELARENSVSLESVKLFYYETFEMEFNEKEMSWSPFSPDSSIVTNVIVPTSGRLEGFDLVTFYLRNSPECSPLSCCALAAKIPTNKHCLIETFDEAKSALEAGKFSNAEPGPYRIFGVYSVDWPEH
jgi:hypothetical protein